MNSEQITFSLEQILPRVQKPGRYVGGEFNQVQKPWNQVDIHIALVFPDIYDIGLPNLGISILYDLINQREDALAERAYLPWVDMEKEMRIGGIPLYSLESKTPLNQFDVIGITLPYETLYTNVLNALDLARIPLLSSERQNHHPLVIAGGHACYNPEPMACFFDAMVIGEGEEIIHKIIDVIKAGKRAGLSRDEQVRLLSKLQGVYVPSLYTVTYSAEGTIESFKPTHKDVPTRITRQMAAVLPPPPTRFLVPLVEVIQDRVAVEIMRGCTRGCRFCQAGWIMRPVRERSVQEILAAIDAALKATGYEEVALLSLSSSDYTHIHELVKAVRERFSGKNLSVALPSLRIESFSVELMDELQKMRPSGGFTLAPEAATDRMRQIINKPVSTEQLLDTVRTVFQHGWTSVKLYFMIGHPEETIEDVQAIVDTCYAVLREGRKIAGGRAKVHAGVSTFIPKPHTPFQWVACDTIEQITAKQEILMKGLKNPNIKLSWVDPKDTLLEAWLSRGDRRTGEVILRAWQNGCKFDAWSEHYNYNAWLTAFDSCGIDPFKYSHRERSLDEILPWSHINSGVRTSLLKQDYLWSKEGKTRSDCREHCFGCGILTEYGDLRLSMPNSTWQCPEV
ncbi:MAG TPA: TIGR03960 family B12-binding radical SAM protein [Anaerolineaceae bacterium]